MKRENRTSTRFPSSDETIESLVVRAVGLEPGAFERLYELHERLVRTLVVAEASDRQSVEDLVQEVFTLAWRRLPTLNHPDRFRPWLLQIARRVVIDHGRRSRRRAGIPVGLESLDATPLTAPGPEEYAEATDLAQRITVAFSRLSQRDVAFILRSADGAVTLDGTTLIDAVHPTTPIANLSTGAAKVGLFRARARLAEQLRVA